MESSPIWFTLECCHLLVTFYNSTKSICSHLGRLDVSKQLFLLFNNKRQKCLILSCIISYNSPLCGPWPCSRCEALCVSAAWLPKTSSGQVLVSTAAPQHLIWWTPAHRETRNTGKMATRTQTAGQAARSNVTNRNHAVSQQESVWNNLNNPGFQNHG